VADTLEGQLAQNQMLVQTREGMGDVSSHPRDVDHLCVFKRKKNALAAEAELIALGYRTKVNRFLFEVHIDAVKSQPTDLETQNAVTKQLRDISTRHQGYYDGWGSMVVLAKELG